MLAEDYKFKIEQFFSTNVENDPFKSIDARKDRLIEWNNKNTQLFFIKLVPEFLRSTVLFWLPL